MKFVLENCLLDLIVVLDLDLGSILIDNSFFFCLSKVGFKYYLNQYSNNKNTNHSPSLQLG
jgi:hypothetical protein